MIIAAALVEKQPASLINQHFGRCEWYGVYDTATGSKTFIQNPESGETAGSVVAGMLAKQGVSIVVAGRFGIKVLDVFQKKNVQMIIPRGNQTWADIINMVEKNN
jgi:predicted Fe-Mo cluster-binding NifX family protein